MRSVPADWLTVRVRRTVLIIVHTVTALNRLADILSVFEADRRIQLVFTFPDASHIPGTVLADIIAEGALTIPWSTARRERYDLAITLHNSGDLHRIRAPLAVLSHGMGYTKNRQIGKSANRQIGKSANRRSVYGLSPEWLLWKGRVVPRAIVLSHTEQRERLARITPQAVDRAVIAGDPCYDRMRASMELRAEYRAALGADSATKVIAVSSTWGPKSLFGRNPELVSGLLAELPMDDHIVALILHPNIWFAHGPRQIRNWFTDALRSGLRLIPPHQGWQQTIIAADLVIGDNGAVTGYGAATGKPVLLAAFPAEDVASGSAIEALGAAVPRLDRQRRITPQLGAAARPVTGVAELASSEPDRAAQHLRFCFYRLMRLGEPAAEPPVYPYPVTDLRPETRQVTAFEVACEWSANTVTVRRWPAEVVPTRRTEDTVLTVWSDHPRRDLLTNADVLVVERGEAAALRERIGCSVAVTTVAPGQFRLYRRKGAPIDLRCTADIPGVLGAVLHSWWIRNGARALPARLFVRLGARELSVTFPGE